MLLATLVSAVLVIGVNPALALIAPSPVPGSGGVRWGVDGRVTALLRIGSVVYIGGAFQNAVASDGSTAPRSNLAAIDTTTGQLTSWAPQADGQVFALATDGTDILAGGSFTTMSGTARSSFAAITQAGSLDSWTADATNTVRCFTVVGSTLYMGGAFGRVDGIRRERLAAIDLSSSPAGAVLPWNPRADRSVFSLASFSNGNVVAGGKFSQVGGDPTQSFITQILPNGTVGTWTDHPIDLIWSVIVVNDVAYAGRGGQLGGSLEAYTSTGTATWHHGADGDVQAVGFTNGQVIAAGHFGNISNVHIPRLAAFSLMNGGTEDTTWTPWPNSAKGVWAVLSTPDTLYVGGDFTTMNRGATPAYHFAQFPVT